MRLTGSLVGLTLNIGFSGAAQAAVQGRDLNGSASSFEAYCDTEEDKFLLRDFSVFCEEAQCTTPTSTFGK